MRISFLIGGVAVAVIFIVAYEYLPDWLAEEPPPLTPVVVSEPVREPVRDIEPDPQPGLPPPPETPSPPTSPVVELPLLDASDPFVLERLADFGLPDLWLAREDLIRRLAVVIDNGSQGEYPRGQLGFLSPLGKFQVVRRGDRLFLDPRSYQRFDVYLDLLENVGPQVLAETLLLFEPLISEGLAELGNQRPMVAQIHVAVSRITELPELVGDIELAQPKVFYEYADPELEALSPLQKQVLRMGPANVRRLRVYLRTFQLALAANDGGH